MTTAKKRVGKCCNEISVGAFSNTTIVPDWRDPSDPDYNASGVPPYPRLDNGLLWPSPSAFGNCPGADASTCKPSGTEPSAHCGPWPYYPYQADASGFYVTSLPEGIDYNSYGDDGIANFAKCRKLGFKNVQASKQWHGRLPFNSTACARTVDESCGCTPMTEEPNATVRYRTVRRSWTQSGDTVTTQTDAVTSQVVTTTCHAENESSRTMSVDRYSGNVTMEECVDTRNSYTRIQDTLAGTDETTPSDDAPSTGISGPILTNIQMQVLAVAEQECDKLSISTVDAFGTFFSGKTAEEIEAAYALNETFDNEDIGDGAVRNGTRTRSAEVEMDDTSITITLTHSQNWTDTASNGSTTVNTGSLIQEVTIELSDEYTADQWKADCLGLLAWWDLTNDTIYPWRTDSFTMIAPLVTYDESTAKNPDAAFKFLACTMFDDTEYPDPLPEDWDTGGKEEFEADHQQSWSEYGYTNGVVNPSPYTGVIRGKPGKTGAKHFDWKHTTWKVCNANDGTDTFYKFGYGAWSATNNLNDVTDEAMPGTATQWTENYSERFIAGTLPYTGAWIIQDGPGMWAQKWAEIKIPRPSHNFARPCGIDRFRLDETTARCVVSVDGSQVELLSATDIVTGDVVRCCGVDGITDGFYTATKDDDTHYSLTALTAWNAISAPLSYNCGSGILGKVRFHTAPPIAGRIAISAATNATPIEITMAEECPYLLTGDHVDISGVLGNTAANVTDQAITVIDSTHFTLDGVAGNGDYTSGGYVVSHGAASYEWNDNTPKSEALYVEWGFNYRDYQERARLITEFEGCSSCDDVEDPGDPIRANQTLHGMPQEVSAFTVEQLTLSPYSIYNAQVLCISPDGEVFKNGVTKYFGEITPDSKYGARWQAAFVQEITDPFWQVPHKVCIECDEGFQETECDNSEDDGGCSADDCVGDCEGEGTYYYAHRPMIEARQGVRIGAPALPSGLFLGFLSLAELDTISDVEGNVLPPPSGLGYVDPDAFNFAIPTTPQTPWGIYLAELECVCSSGRFATEYGANMYYTHCD